MESAFYVCKIYRELTNSYQSPNRNVIAIKSNLLYLMKKRFDEKQVHIPPNLTNGTTCCKWCFNHWTVGNFTSRLIPEKQQKADLRSLLKKEEINLNKFQRKLVRKCKRNSGNKLMFLCHVCNKKSIVHLKKPKVVKPKEDDLIPKEKKAKRKKKDVYAGLKSSCVINAITGNRTQPKNAIQISSLSQKKVNKRKRNKSSLISQKSKVHSMVGNQKLQQNAGNLLLSLLDPL